MYKRQEFCRRLLIGNEDPPLFEREGVSTDRVALLARGLSGEWYVREQNLTVHAGEIVGLYDLNNQKNMELLQILIGESPIREGTLYLNGKKYEPRNLDYAIKNNIGYIPCNRKTDGLVGSMSFIDNLCLPALKKSSRLKIFRNRKVPKFLGKEYMEKLGIPYEEKATKVRYFDEYIQNRILLTRWILFHPTIMVCMEPCGNVDMIMRDIIFQAFAEMARSGSAILIASQNMNELKTICDTIYVLNSDEKTQFERYEMWLRE